MMVLVQRYTCCEVWCVCPATLAHFDNIMVTVPHKMIRLERMLNCRGVGLQRFHCMYLHVYSHLYYIMCYLSWFRLCSCVHNLTCTLSYMYVNYVSIHSIYSHALLECPYWDIGALSTVVWKIPQPLQFLSV